MYGSAKKAAVARIDEAVGGGAEGGAGRGGPARLRGRRLRRPRVRPRRPRWPTQVGSSRAPARVSPLPTRHGTPIRGPRRRRLVQRRGDAGGAARVDSGHGRTAQAQPALAARRPRRRARRRHVLGRHGARGRRKQHAARGSVEGEGDAGREGTGEGEGEVPLGPRLPPGPDDELAGRLNGTGRRLAPPPGFPPPDGRLTCRRRRSSLRRRRDRREVQLRAPARPRVRAGA